MKIGAFSFIIFAFMLNISSAHTNTNENPEDVSIIETSQQLLLLTKTHEATNSLVR